MTCAGVIIVGAGGFGRAVADALGGAPAAAGFVDDRVPRYSTVLGLKVLGATTDLPALRRDHDRLVVAIGDNRRRRELLAHALELSFELAVIVHPRATRSDHARIGPGSIVMAGAIVGCEAQVGSGVIVNAAAVVDHHARIDDNAHLGICAGVAGGAHVGVGAWLHEGVVLAAGQTIEPWAVVGRARGDGA